MIPYGLMRVELFADSGASMNASVLDLSITGFTFRLPRNVTIAVQYAVVTYHDLRDNSDHSIRIDSPEIHFDSEARYWNEYRLETTSCSYGERVKDFMKMYASYVSMKAESDEEAIALELTDRPEPQGYCGDIAEQRSYVRSKVKLPAEIERTREIAIAIDTPSLLARFCELSFERFCEAYYCERGFENHPVTRLKINCVYLGNQFCQELFPDEMSLEWALSKAETEGLKAVICFAPQSETKVDHAICTIEKLLQSFDLSEVVVNDWGLLSRICEIRSLRGRIRAGILLCKRRKDPRVMYLRGDIHSPAYTAMHGDAFAYWLEEHFGVCGISLELCEDGAEVTKNTALHWPLYQIATGTFCPLKAACVNGNRAVQTPDSGCPGYCAENHFFYEKTLNTVGRYNSLFSFTTRDYTMTPNRFVIDLL